MKEKSIFYTFIVLFASLCILGSNPGCSLFDEDDEVDTVGLSMGTCLDVNYLGTFTVEYTSVYPEWEVSTTMNVDLEKDSCNITIAESTLNYSGETIISDDSKISRSGYWDIKPTATVNKQENIVYIDVNGNLTVNSDVQRLYAKNNQGIWILVNETTLDSAPNADLVFNLDDAVLTGSVASVNTGTGSITWTLRLSASLL